MAEPHARAPAEALIKLFERLGWASDVKHPKPKRIEAKRRDVIAAEAAADAEAGPAERIAA